MARGVDELIDHLLSEIALTGVQGAGSADFKRYVQSHYNKSQSEDGSHLSVLAPQLETPFYEKVWQWVIGHADVRIRHEGATCRYTLAEFEAAEKSIPDETNVAPLSQLVESSATVSQPQGHARSLLALKDSVRKRLEKEGRRPHPITSPSHFLPEDIPGAGNNALATQSSASHTHNVDRAPRILPIKPNNIDTVFDDAPTTVTAPRLFASQSRIWQALTGHGIDLKKVPMMEFVLLSLIASHGEAGVTQPDLTVMSGQDKRSVPHRTDELCRKGYIEKRPVQSGKLRTSLCVHKKFVSDDHFLTSGKVEDVFQYKKFVVSGFVHLLYNTLKDAGVVPTRDIRKRLNVPMSTWNKRAVQGALIRLDQSGMVKRFRARRKDSEDNWLTCIEVLREPRPEDHENLKFRRQAALEEVEDDQSDEDLDGDTMMRDLEVDMFNTNSEEVDGGQDDNSRVPPQWVPERLLSNTLYEVVAMGGPEGWDAGVLRDRIVGKFWRRPMESYLTRLTDDWEATQPAHLRHLALIRDTRNTQEKKFVHYVYRTYGNFQKAVEAGEVIWAGVSKPPSKQSSATKGGRPKKATPEGNLIDAWGFRTVEPKNFLNKDGSGSLSECRAAIVHGRKYGPRWDNSFVDDIGYQKIETPKSEKLTLKNDLSRSRPKIQSRLSFPSLGSPGSVASPATPSRQSLPATDTEDATPTAAVKIMGLPKRKSESGLLTIDQRIALGLKPKGRLSKFVEDQIQNHRKRSGDPVSIPDSIELEKSAGTPSQARTGPLMTKEERIAAGLPPRGRLGQKMEDQIREQRGLPKSAEKVKKPRKNRPANEPALLSKEQRIKLGIIPHGRLPQSLMEGLREEREFDIPLEQSKVVPAYLDAVKDKKGKPELTRSIDEVRLQTMKQYDPSRGLDNLDTPFPAEGDEPLEIDTRPDPPTVEKRKTDDDPPASQPSKRVHVEPEAVVMKPRTTIPTPPPTATLDKHSLAATQRDQGSPAMSTTSDKTESVVATSTLETSSAPIASPSEAPVMLDLSEVEAKVRRIKDAYSNRSAPGLYTDPFAKRKIGQGRPRNAFIATFRLPGLSALDCFTSAAAERLVEAQQAPTQATTPAVGLSEKTADQHMLDSSEAITSSAPPEPTKEVPEIAHATSATPESISQPPAEQISAENAVQSHKKLVNEGAVSDQSLPACDTLAVTGRVQNGLDPRTSDALQEHTRPVAGWNAINKPLQTPPAYQSPYAASDTPEALSSVETVPEDGAAVPATQNQENESQIQGVCGPIMEEDTASRSEKKLAAYMGTKMGGGSQKMFRHKIIMQVIDLCNGAYPMHGEIGRPFITLWKQQYPNLAPPNSSTVLSNLRDMIADPCNGLKKFSFLMRLRQSAGLKKKDMVVYQHLTPTSPEVTKLAYKMANYSSTKAHQYYPEEIRHLVTDESFYVPLPVAPKDETISLERLNPSLQHKIKEANLERRRRYYHKQKDEESARNAQNAGVEAPLKRTANVDGEPRARRARLASLNDKTKRYRRAPLSNTSSGPMGTEAEASIADEVLHADNEAGQGLTLTWKKPWVNPIMRHDPTTQSHQMNAQISAIRKKRPVGHLVSSITLPIVRFYATNGTFSTEFGLVRLYDRGNATPSAQAVASVSLKAQSTKRVRIAEPVSQRPVKKPRVDTSEPKSVIVNNLNIDSGEESDNSYPSSTSSSSDDDEDDTPLMQLGAARAEAKSRPEARAKRDAKVRQRGSKKELPPTLLERLTGLTGDPNEAVYLPPKSRLHPRKRNRGWVEKPKSHPNKSQRQRKYSESHDPVDKFKKICCTLVIASSMAGGHGGVDWSIIEKVHSSKSFDIAKTKLLWAWMQIHMASEIARLTASFENQFIAAYEDNEIAAIEDPTTYDWTNLVRWAMHSCVYPEVSLPVYREALQHFIVDLSGSEALDRPKWHRERIADRVRTQIQLQYSFSIPLHQPNVGRTSVNETEVKARSWIRANTATPQAVYDSKTAHEKLRTIGDPVLVKIVGEYVDKQMLRMRKLKRLLPGRNYTFTAKLAKKYVRTFELSDFMAAVKIKKGMDTAFRNEDPGQRFYSLSRAEKDGAIMAVMSLLSEGKVRFIPQTPAVKNEFGAPLPRLSVWGFMEGDYVHRGINRQRLFWDIHVAPTETYEHGNPLQPGSALSEDGAEKPADWLPLLQPPLPGKYNADALLPIWSSIDGQEVTWPWWYRILNLVLQPLIFQPGATVKDIHANCDEHTTEEFEVELVLQWLVSVNAVKQITGGGYVTLPGVWAVFGDVLHDMEDDWLNAHVKRKREKHAKQLWRDQYHSRFSAMRSRDVQRWNDDASDDSDAQMDSGRSTKPSASTGILRRPKDQYAIVRDQIGSALSGPSIADGHVGTMERNAASPEAERSESHSTGSHPPRGLDIEMQDADADADGHHQLGTDGDEVV